MGDFNTLKLTAGLEDFSSTKVGNFYAEVIV